MKDKQHDTRMLAWVMVLFAACLLILMIIEASVWLMLPPAGLLWGLAFVVAPRMYDMSREWMIAKISKQNE